MESPTLPESDELISPRITTTAILSLPPREPRWTIVSRKDGVGSSSREFPAMRRKEVAARTMFSKALAHRATNKKMLKQPSFRLPSMGGETGGEPRRTQEGIHGRMKGWSDGTFKSSQHHSTTPFLTLLVLAQKLLFSN